ncbi:MAG: ABC transporter substrate-binding protein [Actinomycetota bacterium]|nr:ABC transporter substrate-binding protein [Actinomycetota bacterium]
MFSKTYRSIAVILILSFLLVTSVLLAGCGNDGDDAQEEEPTTKVLVDQLGREVELPAEVNRVATNYGIATQIVFALGEQDKLVGCDEPSHRMSGDFFSQIDPDFPEIPAVGNPSEINTETLASLEPDVIFVPCSRGSEQVDQLEALGFNALGVNCEDLDLLAESVEMFGEAMGCDDKADEYVAYYQEIRDMIEERLEDLPDDERATVYLSGSSGMLSTCGGDMYQSYVFDLCGGDNVAEELSGGWKDVSAEQILAWNPEYVLVVHYGTATPGEILADPTFANLTATKDGNVMWFPSELAPWDYPSMQAVLGLVWCAKTLHPDKFQDVDVLEYANEYFEEFFGVSFTEIGGTI